MALRRKNTPEPYRNAEMSEWFKEHDWKSCVRLKRTGGSNPLLCANKKHPLLRVFFCCIRTENRRGFEGGATNGSECFACGCLSPIRLIGKTDN